MVNATFRLYYREILSDVETIYLPFIRKVVVDRLF